MRFQYLWIMLVTTLLSIVVTSRPAVTTPSVAAPIEVVILDDSKALDLWYSRNGDNLSASFPLTFMNKGNADVTVQIGMHYRDELNAVHAITVWPADVVLRRRAATSQRFSVTVPGEEIPQSANLVISLTTAGGTPEQRARAVHGNMGETPRWMEVLIAGIVIGTIGLLWLAYHHRHKGSTNIGLKDPMGLPEWEFKSSWASNITIFGALIGTALSFGALPTETRYMSKPMYESINFFWTILITLAPAIYSFFREDARNEGGDEADPLKQGAQAYHGFVYGFLLSTLFTMLAVYGQLCSLGLLMFELGATHVIPGMALAVLVVLLSVIGIGLGQFAFATVRSTIETQRIAKHRHRTRAAQQESRHIRAMRREEASFMSPDVARQVATVARPAWHPL